MTTGKKVIIFICILAVAGGLIGFGVYNASRQQQATGIPKNAIPVQLENPHRETVISKVSAKGTVELIDTTAVYPATQARIETLHVKAGDTVAEGDLLLTYDIKTLDSYRDQLAEAELALRSAQLALESSLIPASRTEVLQARTQINQAKKTHEDIIMQAAQFDISIAQLNSNIETAQKKYKDTQTLQVMGVATQTETDAARDALKSLQSQLETTQSQKDALLAGLPIASENIQLAQSQYNALVDRQDDPKAVNQREAQEIAIEQAELRISQIQKNIDEFESEERAPVSGSILNVYAAEGDIGTSGRVLMEIAETSLSNLIIRINVPESDAKNIEVGQRAEIKGSALGTQIYDGHIQKIYPLAEKKQIGNSQETVLTVEITPDGSDIKLRAGYSIDTNIITGVAEDTVVVPLMSTLSDADGSYFVYIMREDYSVEKRPITLGEYAGIYVQAGGVTEDDRIILNPSGQINEGVFVKPIAGINP